MTSELIEKLKTDKIGLVQQMELLEAKREELRAELTANENNYYEIYTKAIEIDNAITVLEKEEV